MTDRADIDDNRPHALDLLVAQKKRIAELEAANTKLREAVDFAVRWVEGMPYAGKITDDRIASADDVAAFLSAIRAEGTP